jgi:hypothetical protein
MKTLRLSVLAAGLLTSLPVLAQLAGDTQNTGPQGTGNFVSGKPGEPGAATTGKPDDMSNTKSGRSESSGSAAGSSAPSKK